MSDLPVAPGPRSGPEPGRGSGSVSWTAVLFGALASAIVTVPVSLLAPNDRADETSFLLFAMFLVGFAIGGAVAAWREPDFPFLNGALAPALTVLVVQGLGNVRRLAVGERINWFSFLFLLFLAASCGAVGAAVSYRAGQKRARAASGDGEPRA